MNKHKTNDKQIHFQFFPYNYETINTKNEYLVEKADTEGRKRKYICGVASGLQIDAHGERLTKNAIASMMNQANSGDLLLYNDIHGIRDNEDIGILDSSEILPNGDWKTNFRLYDEFDKLGPEIVEKNNKLWKKMNGFPPYTKIRQKGFSIEGYVPEKSILSINKDGGQRVIDDVQLDGVVLVPRPAYNSVTEAVYKCLGEMSPEVETKVRKNISNTLSSIIGNREKEKNFYTNKYELESALDTEIKKIMEDKFENKQDRLEILFDEYKALMIALVLESSDLFEKEIPETKENEQILKSEKITNLLLKTEKSIITLMQKIKEVKK